MGQATQFDYNWYQPKPVNYQTQDFTNTGILGAAPAWQDMMRGVQTQLPGGGNSKIPDGYSPYIAPSAEMGYDNKGSIYSWLNNPGNGALDWNGKPVSGFNGTQKQSVWLPNNNLSSVPMAFNKDPSLGGGGGALNLITAAAMAAAGNYAGAAAGLGSIGTGALSGGLGGFGGTGTLDGALKGALAGGIGGAVSGANGVVSNSLSKLGVPDAVLPSATRGVVTAGKGLLSGQNFGDSLTNGLASGAGGYAGTSLKGLMSGGGLPDSVTQGISQAGAGAVGSAINGRDIGQGALLSGLGGAANGLGSDLVAGSTQPQWLQDLIRSAPGAGLNLYQQSQGGDAGGMGRRQFPSASTTPASPQRAQLIAQLRQRMGR